MKNKERYIWIAVLTLTVILFSSLYLTDTMSSNRTSNMFLYGRIFEQTLKIVRNNYVDPKKAKAKSLYFGAIEGLLKSLDDQHTSFLSPKIWKELRESLDGKFEGLGIHIGIRDDMLTVIAPIEGSPAWKEGLHPNDIIYKIEGKPTKGITLTEAVTKLRGKRGTKVTITIVRQGAPKPFKVTITRDVIKIPSIRYDMIDNKTGYIRIIQFQSNVVVDMRRGLKKLYKKGMKKLVLDLRNNPGGYLGKAADIVDLFISKGRIVSSKGRISIDDQVFYAHSFNTACRHTPLIVLINKGSASASEIVAGAIKDTNRGVVVGLKSYGKGSVQRVIQLASGDEEFGLKLTTAYYYTAAGRLIHEKGIKPDFEIKTKDYTLEEILAQRIISKKDLVKKFVKRVRKPNTSHIKAFHKRLQKQNLPIPIRLLAKMIYNELHKTDMPPVFDLEWDIQLQEALKIFNKRPELFKRKILAYENK